MAPSRPPWVIKDLSSILGLDEESISQLLLPEFEAYTSQVNLKSHLQDFLGPSAPAKTFTDKYLSFRFPSLTASSVPTPSLAPSLKPPAGPKAPGISGSGSHTPANPTSASRGQGSTSSQSQSIPDALQAAFGPGGKIYQKNRDADSSLWSHPNTHTHSNSQSRNRSQPPSVGGSGAATPDKFGGYGTAGGGPVFGRPGPARVGGAVTITQARTHSGKGKDRALDKEEKKGDRIWDLPKSEETKRLEGIMRDLREVQAGEGKVKVDGKVPPCFCQARIHDLSPYTPHCPSCGLILCTLHPAHHPCPSCLHPILSPAALARLLLRIQDDLDAQLAREQAARDEVERARIAAVQAQAAFPYLSGTKGSGPGPGSGPLAQPVPGPAGSEGRKVLTIGSKGKGKGKAKTTTLTTTYTRPTPTPSPQPGSSGANTNSQGDEIPSDIIPRPRSAPMERSRTDKELEKALRWREEEDRPWGDSKMEKKGEGWKYLPLPVLAIGGDDQVGRRRKKKGMGTAQDGVGRDGRVVVGAV